MTDAPEHIFAKRQPNGALGYWHDATSNETTARIASKDNPFVRYVRAEAVEADRDRLAAKLVEAEAQAAALRGLLTKCRPSVANMAYGWPEDDELVKEIDAALSASGEAKP